MQSSKDSITARVGSDTQDVRKTTRQPLDRNSEDAQFE